jgi:hypothetical protein
LTGEQWDRLVDKMHQSNRTKQSAMIKEQNQGLAHELGGYLFKPRLNKTSLDLSATMKSLHLRMPEMIAERKKELEAKRKEASEVRVSFMTRVFFFFLSSFLIFFSLPVLFSFLLYNSLKLLNVLFHQIVEEARKRLRNI